MIITIANQCRPIGMIAHFSKQALYGVQVQSAKHNLGLLSDPRSEWHHSNMNEQSRVQCGTNQKDVYIRRVKTV
jgi:hypothetical protein